MAKRNQKPEVRKAQREQAVRAAKDQKKATVKKPVVKVRSLNYLTFLGKMEGILSYGKLIFTPAPPCRRLKEFYILFPGQGCAEGTEGNKERPQGWPRQGWWQEINILPSNSCGNLFNK